MIVIRRAELTDAVQIQKVYACSDTYAGTLQLPHPSLEMWQERLKSRDPDDTSLVATMEGGDCRHGRNPYGEDYAPASCR